MKHVFRQLGQNARDPELLAASLATLIVVFLLLLFVTHFFVIRFTSDDAALNMLADEMWRQGRLFPRGWITNNGDLMMPSMALVLAPLLRWLPNSFGLHSIASVLAVAITLASFGAFLQAARVPMPVRLVALAVMATGPSWLLALMIYGQTTYMWWAMALPLGATLIWSYRTQVRDFGKFDSLRLFLLCTLVFALTVENPSRAILMLVLPLYAFDRVVHMGMSSLEEDTDWWKKWLIRLGLRDRLALLGIFGGFLLAATGYYLLVKFGVIETRHFASSIRWGGLEAVSKNLRVFAAGWLPTLGADDSWGTTGSLFELVLQKIRLLFAIWLTWVAVAEISRAFRPSKPNSLLRQATVFGFLAAFVPVFALYVGFDPLAVDESTMRYFTVPIVILIALAAIRVGASLGDTGARSRYATIVASVLVVAVAVQRYVPPTWWSSPRDFWATHTPAGIRFAEVLRKEGLKWGYATWWNAGVSTVLADGQARIHPIDLSGKRIERFPMIVQRDWYAGDQWRGESFIALDHTEDNPEQIAIVQNILGRPKLEINSQDYLILVYDHNIAADLWCEKRSPMSVKLDGTRPAGRVVAATQSFTSGEVQSRIATVTVLNDGDIPLDGSGDFPISIGIQLLDNSGSAVANNWRHFLLPCPIGPGEERTIRVSLPVTPPGNWQVSIDLVQEGVAWFEQWGAPTVLMSLQPTPP